MPTQKEDHAEIVKTLAEIDEVLRDVQLKVFELGRFQAMTSIRSHWFKNDINRPIQVTFQNDGQVHYVKRHPKKLKTVFRISVTFHKTPKQLELKKFKSK